MASTADTQEMEARIIDAVFELMKDTDVPNIKVIDVVRQAHVSKSTFYRYFESVDAVVKRFEDQLLENMGEINEVALKARFSDAELDPTPTMVCRMEIMQQNRDKIVALNGPHGDPTFTHKATVFMHEHFRRRLQMLPCSEETWDLYLSFALAGHNNLIQYWLEEKPEVEPCVIATALNRFFYAPFFLEGGSARHQPTPLHFEGK